MTVIAFRPRPLHRGADRLGRHASVTGTFQSPRGRSGRMRGLLRVGKLVLLPSGTGVMGVFTAELREADGSLIGFDSRRATVAADPVHDDRGLRLHVAPLELDLMGMTVRLDGFTIEPPPRRPLRGGERR